MSPSSYFALKMLKTVGGSDSFGEQGALPRTSLPEVGPYHFLTSAAAFSAWRNFTIAALLKIGNSI
jgi:hypothetical protein